MGRYRAVMTDTDREYIAGGEDVDEHKRYQAISRVRSRITEELATDVALLEEHKPELLEELREVVCDDTETAPTDEAEGSPVESASGDPIVESEPRGSHREDGTPEPAPVETERAPREAAEEIVEELRKEWWVEGDLEAATDAVVAAYEFLQEEGGGVSKGDFLQLRSEHPGPYEPDPADSPDGRDRGAWWREVVRPALSEMPGVERYGQNGRNFRYVGE